MGDRKSGLLRAEHYAMLKAAELATEMIAAFERDRAGPVELRVEVPQHPEWDDVHVRHAAHLESWQVKRLTKAVADSAARKLIIAAADAKNGSTNALNLGVAKFVDVKKGNQVLFDLGELAGLCQAARQPGIVGSEFLTERKDNAAYRFVRDSVPLASEDEAFSLLRRLHVVELGLEEEILARAQKNIDDVFTNSKEIIARLAGWFQAHPDGAVHVTIDVIYKDILGTLAVRDHARPIWIQLMRNSPSGRWEIRGPLEHPLLVELAWTSNRVIRVQLPSPAFPLCRVTASLTRLLLHSGKQVRCESHDSNGWSHRPLQRCGDTVGFLDEPTMQLHELKPGASAHSSTGLSELELSNQLSNAMAAAAWSEFEVLVEEELIGADLGGDLRTAMRQHWTDLNAAVSGGDLRERLLASMMLTAEEASRPGFESRLRVGCLTARSLARAMLVALAILASSSADSSVLAQALQSGATPNNFLVGTQAAHVMAIVVASLPGRFAPVRLTDHLAEILAHESAISILASVDAPARSLYETAIEAGAPFSASQAAIHNYSNPGPPPLFLTACCRLRASMRKGLAAVRVHVEEQLAWMASQNLNDIKQVLGGIP